MREWTIWSIPLPHELTNLLGWRDSRGFPRFLLDKVNPHGLSGSCSGIASFWWFVDEVNDVKDGVFLGLECISGVAGLL